MSSETPIPDLLPWNFVREVVLTPEKILDYQALLIERKSVGRLRCEVRRAQSEKLVSLSFIVSAPLINYAMRLFTCSHHPSLPYPTSVNFQEFGGEDEVAESEEDFRNVIKKVFGSAYARSVVESLLARVGDVSETDANTPQES